MKKPVSTLLCMTKFTTNHQNFSTLTDGVPKGTLFFCVDVRHYALAQTACGENAIRFLRAAAKK